MTVLKIVIEGGGDSNYLHIRCRQAFRILLEQCGFNERMPRLLAGGGRNSAYKDFINLHKRSNSGDYIGLLVDSEEVLADTDKVWEHLKNRDNWDRPTDAEDEQVLLMTTSMETWVAADRKNLAKHYGNCLQANALPANANLETVSRQEVLEKLSHATRKCNVPYQKGKQSFELLQGVNPAQLKKLASFNRMLEILNARLT